MAGLPAPLAGELPGGALHRYVSQRRRLVQHAAQGDAQPHPDDPDRPGDRAGEPADIVKGYEIEKGRYVVVTDEEIKNVRLETTRTIDIERFVDAGEIDRLYWNDPYFLAPTANLPRRLSA